MTGVKNALTIKVRHAGATIQESIASAMHRTLYDANTVHVGVNKGEVMLSGTVNSLEQWMMASATAWKAPGVTAVRNDLTVI